MTKRIIPIIGILLISCVGIFADISCWKLGWNISKMHYEGLMLLSKDKGIMRVKVFDSEKNKLVALLDEDVFARILPNNRGVTMNCSNVRFHLGKMNYAPDNFLIKGNSILMIDETGFWTSDATITQVTTEEEFLKLLKAYGINIEENPKLKEKTKLEKTKSEEKKSEEKKSEEKKIVG